MKNTRIIVAAAVVILVAVVGYYWWLQWRTDNATQSDLLVHQPASDTMNQVKPPQKIAESKPSSLAVEVTEDGQFTVQISAWRSSINAKREVERFQRAGYNAFVERADIPSKGGLWYRVRVGQFSTRAEAERQARELEVQLDTGYWITHKE